MSTPLACQDSDIPLPHLRSISQLWSLAAVLAGLGVAALAVDVPMARWIEGDGCPMVINKLCSLSEVASHGWGVLVVALFVAVLDPSRRAALPRILAASLGSGLAANFVKLLVARTRPSRFLLDGRGLDSFGDWLPLWSNASWAQSFPSSHAATAAGLAIVLAYYYPRGRWLFPAVVGFACFQRVTVEAHFVSDVLWGAAVGCIFAPLCVYGSQLSLWFSQLETWLLSYRWVSGDSPDSPARPIQAARH